MTVSQLQTLSGPHVTVALVFCQSENRIFYVAAQACPDICRTPAPRKPFMTHAERRQARQKAQFAKQLAKKNAPESARRAQVKKAAARRHQAGAHHFKPMFNSLERFGHVFKDTRCNIEKAMAYFNALGLWCHQRRRPGVISKLEACAEMVRHDLRMGNAPKHPTTYERYWRESVRTGLLVPLADDPTYYVIDQFVEYNGGAEYWAAMPARIAADNAKRAEYRRKKDAAKRAGQLWAGGVSATINTQITPQSWGVSQTERVQNQIPLGVLGLTQEDLSARARPDRLPSLAQAKPRMPAAAMRQRRPSVPRQPVAPAGQQACVLGQGPLTAPVVADKPDKPSASESIFLARASKFMARQPKERVEARNTQADQYTPPQAATPAPRQSAPPGTPKPMAAVLRPPRVHVASPADIREELAVTGLDPRVLRDLDKQRAFDMFARFGLEAKDWGFIGAYAADRNPKLGPVRRWRGYLRKAALNHLASFPALAA